MPREPLDPELAREAKAIVAIAFRNGPIEALHSGRDCPARPGTDGVSDITDEEIGRIMKVAVDRVYSHLVQRAHDPEGWERTVAFGSRFTGSWDDPAIIEDPQV